jgi:hypothetical protein
LIGVLYEGLAMATIQLTATASAINPIKEKRSNA